MPELADALGIVEASVRVALRNHDIAKNGRSYGWNSKKEFDEVVAKLRKEPKTSDKPKAKVKAAGTQKAKPTAKKATAKPVPKKKAA